eukprot:CAMPEP_0176494632 /NCGR_PEP_ID=MMETSP0200_2-20121128/10211_1 /TAXON_ID=947934 /ORGANISM="Chaetoceros sp., Strain GSL56" /LENGTH=514 /DNA_ID=CAMNT_0017892425 /DNA_START=59 /DNA_END=1604 /DNA_ORIENTATION=+
MTYKLFQRRFPFAFHLSGIQTSRLARNQRILLYSPCHSYDVNRNATSRSFILPYHQQVRSSSPKLFSTSGNRPIVSLEHFKKHNDKLAQDVSTILHKVDLAAKDIANAKSLIHVLSNLRTFQGAHLAEEILERLISEGADGGNSQVQLESKLYNTIVDAYGKSGEGSGVDKAEALVERMKERSRVLCEDLGNDEKVDFIARPDLFSYNSLLNAWSHSKRGDAVTKAENIVAFLESSSTDVDVKPNSITYNIMMNTYANQVGEYGYAQKAEDILLHMTSLQKDGYESIHPDTTSFNIVLKAWKNSGGGVESAKRAEEILRLMVKLYIDGHYDLKPDNVSFRTVIHAYMNHGENGKFSSEIVDRIQGIGELVLNGDIDFIEKNPQIVSEVISEILKCLAKSGVPDAGERAKNLFDKMNQARDTNDPLNVENEGGTYVNTMIALLSDPKTAHLGREMMQDMLEGKSSVLPTTYAMNRILHFYCQKQNFAAAQDLYQTMVRLAKTQGFERTRPDVATI